MDLIQTQEAVRELQNKWNHSKGQVDKLMEDLKTMGFGSEEEAEEALETLREQIKKKRKRINTLLKEFHEEFEEYL